MIHPLRPLTALVLLGSIAAVPATPPRFAREGEPMLLPEETGRILTVDLDGDKRPEWLLDRHLYHRTAGGGWQVVGTLPQGGPWQAVDVDGDGDLDLLSTKRALLLNDGKGNWTDVSKSHLIALPALPILAVGSGEYTLCDMDNDGDPDVILGNLIIRNDGRGGFNTSYAPLPPGHAILAPADLDRDGDMDLVSYQISSTTHFEFNVFRNDGAAGFVRTSLSLPWPLYPLGSIVTTAGRADLDGDGDTDLVVDIKGYSRGRVARQEVVILLGDGAGGLTLSPHALPSLIIVYGYHMGDLQGDGRPELLAYGTAGTRVYGSLGSTPTLLAKDADHMATAFADVDGDGASELLYDRRCYLFYHRGRLIDPFGWCPPIGTGFTLLADLDEDGFMDFITGGQFDNPTRSLTSHPLPGRPNRHLSFAQPIAWMPLYWAAAKACCDVDGDGHIDLVAAHSQQLSNQTQLWIYRGSGSGSMGHQTTLDTGHSSQAVALGDVDGDGRLDLVAGTLGTNQTTYQNRLYLGQGGFTFKDVTATHLPTYDARTQAAALVDLDRDGVLELITLNRKAGQWRLRQYENDGKGHFTDVTAARMPTQTYRDCRLWTSDLDGDGAPDIILGAPGRAILIGDGRGTLADRTATHLPTAGPTEDITGVGDLDGDGDLDLCTTTSALLGDGRGRFTHGGLPWSHLRGSLVDLDSDGDLDLAGQVNLTRHLLPASLPRLGAAWHLQFHARPVAGTATAIPLLAAGKVYNTFPPLGIFLLDPATLFALPPITVDNQTGYAPLALSIPNHPHLAHQAVHAQALVHMDGGWRFTNAHKVNLIP